MKVSPARHRNNANTTVLALLMLTVLSLVAATVLLTITTRYGGVQQVGGWKEALNAADSGADIALQNLRWSVTGTSNAPFVTGTNYSPRWTPLYSSSNEVTYSATNGSFQLPVSGTMGKLTETGEGTNTLWAVVVVDGGVPAGAASPYVSGTFLKNNSLANSNPWFRIRSTGYANLTALSRANNDRPDGTSTHADTLRKFDLKFDHFIATYGDPAKQSSPNSSPSPSAAAVSSPQATRRVEMIVRPITAFQGAISASSSSNSSVSVPYVDSYNSTDTTDWPQGRYENGSGPNTTTGLGTNGNVYVNGPVSSMGGQIYGNLNTNGGSATSSNSPGVTGSINNSAVLPIPVVTKPSWATITGNNPGTIVASAALTTYSLTDLTSGITVTLGGGRASAEVDIYTSGDVNSGISVAPGVTLKIWFAGNLSMKARDIDNQNYNASYLQLYGIDPPAGQSGSITFGSGNPGYRYFTVLAPQYDFSVNGNPDFCGSFFCKTVSGNGNTSWHYDEALGDTGPVIDYKAASWVEDER